MVKVENKQKLVKGYISGNSGDYFKEQFKSETSDKIIKWPKELGVEHPFSFEDMEKVFKKFGVVSGIINKTVDHIVGEFTVESDYPTVVKATNEFIKDNNFSCVLRDWIREALMKGNGFMEVNVKTGECRVINANDMYVVRNRKGEVTGYNQYIGDLDKGFYAKKVINFKPNEIAHLIMNATAGEAYGCGLIYPNERTIENLILSSQDEHKLMSRKAGAPLHAKFGVPGESVAKSDIDDMKTNMQYMSNRTEWATDANVEFKVIDFGPLEKLGGLMERDMKELIAGMDIPEVFLNSGQLNEGIAKTQQNGWKIKIMNLQDMIEYVIIQKIFKPYLEMQGLSSEDLDFIWNLPSEEDINLRLTQLNTILGNMSASENMKRMVQLEIARLLNIQEASEFLPAPEVGLDEKAFQDKQDAQKMGAGLVPDNSKPFIPPNKELKKKVPVTQSHVHEAEVINPEMTVREWLFLKEAAGFTYSDYLSAILKETKIDKFDNLKAVTESDIQNGLFPETDIEKLRTILKEGFRRNQTLKQISDNIKEGINVKDRITETGATIAAETRPETIARTETLRLSANAIYNLYEENGINKYQFISSPGACEICQGLDNGEIRLLSESVDEVNYPPIHPSCRCFPLAIR